MVREHSVKVSTAPFQGVSTSSILVVPTMSKDIIGTLYKNLRVILFSGYLFLILGLVNIALKEHTHYINCFIASAVCGGLVSVAAFILFIKDNLIV